MDLEYLILLFPVVFMFHDFEEIIFFKIWLVRNKELLNTRFPKLARRIVPHMENLSTAAFSMAVAEEFILISLITYTSIWLNYYYLWFAIFMAFSLHLIGHLIQWIIFRKYVPSIVTTLMCLPYCIYTIYIFATTSTMGASHFVLLTVLGLVLMVVNLMLAHRLALFFERWKDYYQKN